MIARWRRCGRHTSDDLGDVFLLPAEDLGDHALRQTGDVELRGGGAAQIMEVQIADTGGDLGAVKDAPNPFAVHGRPKLFVRIVVERFGMRASTSRSSS